MAYRFIFSVYLCFTKIHKPLLTYSILGNKSNKS